MHDRFCLVYAFPCSDKMLQDTPGRQCIEVTATCEAKDNRILKGCIDGGLQLCL